MDKSDYIKIAPAYYALAVLLAFDRVKKIHLTEFGILEVYKAPEEDQDYGTYYMSNAALLKVALRVLGEQGIIVIVDDPFGPPIYKRGETFDAYLQNQATDPQTLYSKARLSGDAYSWITSALRNVDSKFAELEVWVIARSRRLKLLSTMTRSIRVIGTKEAVSPETCSGST